MEATTLLDVEINATQDARDEQRELVRELTSLELALVGGGTANVAFM